MAEGGARGDDHYLVLRGRTHPEEWAATGREARDLLAARVAEDPDRWAGARCVAYGEWLAEVQEKHLAEPVERVGEDLFDEALNALPPIWCAGVGDLAFMIPEALTDGVHVQYARFGDVCLRRNVRRGDRSTYLGPADAEALAARGPRERVARA